MVSNVISCVVEDGKIFQTEYISGNKTQIGVTTEEFNQQTEILDTYYNKLVELGAIEKEKTPEEIQQENQEMIKTLLTKINDLEKKMEDKDEPKSDDRKVQTSGKNVQSKNGQHRTNN